MKATQSALEIGADRKIRLTSKPVYGEWLYDEKNQKAWHSLSRLFSRFEVSKGKLGLVLDKRFAIPLNPYERYDKEELNKLIDLDKSAATSLSIAMGQAEKEGTQHIIAWGVVAVVSAITLVVIILAGLVASGRLGS